MKAEQCGVSKSGETPPTPGLLLIRGVSQRFVFIVGYLAPWRTPHRGIKKNLGG
jgi:hypothetical protein